MTRDPLSPDRTEVVFADAKPAYTPAQAVIEAERCHQCHDAPCVSACPTAIDIPGFIRRIATGNARGAAGTIFASNVLGMSCARVCPVEVLCLGHCVYHEQGLPPIPIGRLQRYATDAAFAAGWTFFQRAPETGRTVALIGAGPASLACAHRLSVLGHRCVVLEKRPLPGGLNTTGVAPHKMRADRALAEVDWVLSVGGIELRTGVEVTDPEALEREYDAVFVGVGLGEDARLGVPGEDLPGIFGAVDFIERLKLGTVSLAGVGSAAVIGGGNTAVDAARELRTLGVPRVRLVYRGDESAMSGYAHEWDGAKKEGAEAVWNAVPVAFEGDGAVRRIRCAVTRDRRPVPGEEFVVEADRVLLAIGQAKLGEVFGRLPGIALDRGRVVVDADGFTGRRGWYAGGDCANGGKEVVNAAAEGRRAADAIHRHLQGGRDA